MRGLHLLSIEQLLFIEHYVEHRDTAEAYKLCCPDHADMSKEECLKAGKVWLEDDIVSMEVKRRIRVQLTVNAISQAEIANELRKVAFFDMRDLFDEEGNFVPVSNMDAETAQALSHFDVIQQGERGNIIKATPANKLKALELLGKYRKMFTDKIEVNQSGTLNVNIDWVDAPPKEITSPVDLDEEEIEEEEEAEPGPGGFD